MKAGIITLALAAIIGGGTIWYINTRVAPTMAPVNAPAANSSPLSPAPANNQTPANTSATPSPAATPPNSTTPAVFNLPIPFTPQAPTANWDELHNEACEEASAIMANAYFIGRTDTTLPASYVEDQISKLTTWQQQNFGYNLDTTGEETAQMIEKVYGLHTKIISRYTADQLKQELQQKHVVILPEQGQQLGNPNYKQPGPVYHMLVVRGFDKNGFITNDSGTRRGLNYPYTFNTLYSAAGDWNHSTNNVDQTKKIAIIVWK